MEEGRAAAGADSRRRDHSLALVSIACTAESVPGLRAVKIPERLAFYCRRSEERTEWLRRLPRTLEELRERWSLSIGDPFDGEDVSCSWVAPVIAADGTRAVLKIGMPQMEAEHELHGLLFWNGDAAVRVLAHDEESRAMLLERCEPGAPLRTRPEPEQDVVIAGLLRRLWRAPVAPHPFRPLSEMIACWSTESSNDVAQWPDASLVRAGLRIFEELARSVPVEVLLATDLHAGNVLQSRREPWLMIDPKPFVGDPAYDATQHLLNCPERLQTNPIEIIRRMAGLVEVDFERVRLWTFARAAAEPRDNWRNSWKLAVARSIAP